VPGREEHGGGKAVLLEDGERVRREILETVIERQNETGFGELLARLDILHGFIEPEGAVPGLAKILHVLFKHSGRRCGFEVRMRAV
jgi:hypothetical protein